MAVLDTKKPPLDHSGIWLIGVIPDTFPNPSISTQWKVDSGGTTIMEAPALLAVNRSIIPSSGASVSTSA